MRQFHSYGPVDEEQHFCVPRSTLVERCMAQLIGHSQKGGYYFTIWAARQAGKTWLMRQVKQEIGQQYGDQFTVFHCSFETMRGMDDVKKGRGTDIALPLSFRGVLNRELPDRPEVNTWDDFANLFSKDKGLWDRPLILLIDEVDTVPPHLLDLIVGQFRKLYLDRENHWLHGLALIGVRAVLGLDSQRGSPFNIQRSLHVPNLTEAEVADLYAQYQAESGQAIDPAVIVQVYEVTRGQPGLVSWLGELLTETYNPGKEQAITLDTWAWVWHMARFIEPNNTLVNLVAKARQAEYQPFLMKLFGEATIPFSFHTPLHNYLYMHGIIEPETRQDESSRVSGICRFSSPFVQSCLYDALSEETVGHSLPILGLDPLDELSDIFGGANLDLFALLDRYKAYLVRLKAKGLSPWKGQPRRKTDLHLTEAVGHFHLYTWLQAVLRPRCVVSPEFPTGNGKVDLHLRCGQKQGIIEVKSFVSAYQLKLDRETAAQYAKSLGLGEVIMAVFIPVEDEAVLATLSGQRVIKGVQVRVVAISWV